MHIVERDISAIAMAHLAPWNVSEETIAPCLQRLREEWTTAELASLTHNQPVGLVFLYVKKFLEHEMSVLRKLSFSQALGIVPVGATMEEAESIRAKGERLLVRLLGHLGDTTFASTPADWHSLALLATVPALEAWANPASSRVFFRDVVPGCEVQRVQKSGLCFMHGSDVVLHYAVAKSTGRADHRMVDLTLFMLGHVPTGNLWKFISDDSCSNSVEFLRQLGALTGRDDTHTMHSDAMSDPGAAERARDLLDAHGPALISNFKTHDGFKVDAGVFSHRGASAEEVKGSHAMALVGYRTDLDGSIVFLVQNWWKPKQYFEADLAYLWSRYAHLTWVTKAAPTIPETWPTTDLMCAENDLTGEDKEEADASWMAL